MTIKRVYLIGFMGCGKSTVGKSLAQALKWDFIDLDTSIEHQQGKTISSIFRDEGETRFREVESDALQAVTKMENVIIASGGGTPCYHGNMELMKKSGLTIYLKLTPQELCNRLNSAKESRPLIAGKTNQELLSFIENKLSEREPVYSMANVIADATAIGPEPYISIMKMYEQHN